jgi:hypothetical protein
MSQMRPVSGQATWPQAHGAKQRAPRASPRPWKTLLSQELSPLICINSPLRTCAAVTELTHRCDLHHTQQPCSEATKNLRRQRLQTTVNSSRPLADNHKTQSDTPDRAGGFMSRPGRLPVGSAHGYSCCSPAGSMERSNLFGSHWSNQWLAQSSQHLGCSAVCVLEFREHGPLRTSRCGVTWPVQYQLR